MTKIYTKTGDEGETSLYGGERLSKDNLRVKVYGLVDECNAAIGLARAHLENEELDNCLVTIQNTLLNLGADLATRHSSKYRQKIKEIGEDDVRWLEHTIDHQNSKLPDLKAFILPGGHPAAAALHVARAVARHAERELVALSKQEEINKQTLIYLNRLSDNLFVLARAVNMHKGINETKWQAKV